MTRIELQRSATEYLFRFECRASSPAASGPGKAVGDPDLCQVEYVQIQMPVGEEGGCLHLTVTRAGQTISERDDKLRDPIPGWRGNVSECADGWRAEIALPVAHMPGPSSVRFARWIPDEGITRWPTPFGSWWHVDARDFVKLSDDQPAAGSDLEHAVGSFIETREKELSGESHSRLKVSTAAEGDFLKHLQQRVRSHPCLGFEDLPPADLPRCDEMLEGRFCYGGRSIEIKPPMDWDSDRGDVFTMGHLTRFDFLAELVAAYRATQQPAYARKAIECIESWLHGYDARQSLTPQRYPIRWGPIFMSHRLVCMTRAVFSLLSTGLVSEQSLRALYKAVADVARVLHGRIARSYPKNHSIIIANHMVQLSVLCEELENAEWIRDAYMEHFRHALQVQFLPDDVQWELSTMYHMVCYQRLTEATSLCEKMGVPVPADITEWRRRILNVAARYLLPNGEVAAFNDGLMSGRVDAIGRPDDTFTDIIVREGPALGIPEALALATHGAKGSIQPPFSHAMPYAGHYILRDGIAPTSMALAFDAGPFGIGHQHEDALTLILACHGKTLLTDLGSGSYDSNDPMRAYSMSTAAHSTICVDHQQQASRLHPKEWRRTTPWERHHYFGRWVQFAEGEYNLGYGNDGSVKVTHRRAILFVNHAFVVVLDFLGGDGEHLVESHFAVAPLPFQQTPNGLRTVSGTCDLDIQFLYPRMFQHRVAFGQKQPLAGWMIDGRPHPRLTFEVRKRMPCCLVTLLTPFKDPTQIARAATEEIERSLRFVLTTQNTRAELVCDRVPLALSFRDERVHFRVSTDATGELRFREQPRDGATD